MKMTRDERIKQSLKLSELRSQGLVYRLLDIYEMDSEVLGYASTRGELRGFINQRIVDTDGECYLITQKWDVEKNGYATIN